jgi:hypothetical protein
MKMLTLDVVKARLDDISWEEFCQWQLTDAHPERGHSRDGEEIQDLLRQLATQISVGILDQLEEEGLYLKWVLRLSPFVKDENSYDRAKRSMHSKASQVRYWAEHLMNDILPD